MNSFLFPKEGHNTLLNYIISLVVILIGAFIIGASIAFSIISLNVPNSEIEKGVNWAMYFTKNQALVINLIPFFVGVLSVFFISNYILKRPIFSLITVRLKIDFKRVGLAFLIFIIVLSIESYIQTLFDPKAIVFKFKAQEFFLLLMIGIFAIPLQTLFEELLFRGFLVQFGMRFLRKGVLSILFSSLTFMLMHLANPEVNEVGFVAIFYYILSGVFASLISVMDDGIELAWGFHFANNFFVLVLCNTTWGALQTDSLFLDLSEPSAGLSALIVPCVTFPLILFLFGKIYKWENWKSKLF